MTEDDHGPDPSRASAPRLAGRSRQQQTASLQVAGLLGCPLRHQARPSHIEIRKRHGIWQVREGGVFRGDYHQEEHARAAAAQLEKSP
ncbi:hypothetical protein [Sagittula sp. MA-2]|jgi:hypothetical protein|uniref:hypothetical protein n=1 Tax=Sagittula sp. MA-2 TaxID=3048007 RepID=UPI0024C3F4F8|nr:hypothetical protein [Sagittula sp. MA-2]WHZ33387.1 hypothetical protein QNI11_12040 [Sagittula sp. MA-2]